MANNENLSPQQRALLFGSSTRQHYQMLGQQDVTGGAQTMSFRIPKARILQGIKLYVEGDLLVKHASGTAKPLDKLAIYNILRRVSVDYNNGFMPVVASGGDLAVMNMLRPLPEMVYPAIDDSTLCKCPASLAASSAGTSNKFSFMLDVPLTLNERDPVGLVLAQNMETAIDIQIDVANAAEIINNASGYTMDITTLKVTPMCVTFSIPSDARAFPDMSVLKIVDSRTESFTGSGQNHVKLPVGMIYRKLVLKLMKDDGTPMLPADITSNIELVLNTADIPYSVNPSILRAINKMQNGIAMPDGIYFFDFSYQGVCNYGGSRDYIDTEAITEFTLRFTTSASGKVVVISEKLSRLI